MGWFNHRSNTTYKGGITPSETHVFLAIKKRGAITPTLCTICCRIRVTDIFAWPFAYVKTIKIQLNVGFIYQSDGWVVGFLTAAQIYERS